MRIYTEVNYEWDDKQGKLIETSSKSFDYYGELALCEDYDEEYVSEDIYDGEGRKFTVTYKLGTNWQGHGVLYTDVKDANGERVYEIHKDYTSQGQDSDDIAKRRANVRSFIETGTSGGSGIDENVLTPHEGSGKSFTTGALGTADEVGVAPELLAGLGETLGGSLADFKEIKDPNVDDAFTDELVEELGVLERDRVEVAEDAMTTFTEGLSNQWDAFIAQQEQWHSKYASEPFTDSNNNEIWDEGEPFIDENEDEKYTEGTELQRIRAQYDLDLLGPAELRRQALQDRAVEFGDLFIDENNNNRWDEGEEWGDEWSDTDGNAEIDAGELGQSSEASNRGYQAGTEQAASQAVYDAIAEEYYGNRAQGVTEDSQDYIEGSYYRDTRLAEEDRADKMSDLSLTRGEQFAAFREAGRAKISEANAAVAGRGFASSGVGHTAREQLSIELGAEATGIKEGIDELKSDIASGYEEDISGIEERTNIAMSGAESNLANALSTYYTDSNAAAESAQSSYNTSETILAGNRDLALKDAAGMLTDPTQGIGARQAEFKTTAETLKGGWEAGARTFRGQLEERGAPVLDWESASYLPFELTKPGGATTRQRAEDELTELGSFMEEQIGGITSVFTEFKPFTSPTSPLAGHELKDTLDYDPDSGLFGFDAEGMFDPGVAYTAYDPATEFASWLYQPEYKMPWEEGSALPELSVPWSPGVGL